MNQLEASRWSVNKDMDSNEVTDVIRIPGKEWQETQFYNIDNCRNVSVPGYFDVCMSIDRFSLISLLIYAVLSMPTLLHIELQRFQGIALSVVME
jgi:hypothetical protein